MASELRTINIRTSEGEFTADTDGPETGELVLFLHGFPQTRYTWRHEAKHLAGAGYRAVAFDQRGYSRGARFQEINDYRLENLVQDVLDVADALGQERFHLVGHDWGGQVGWCQTWPKRRCIGRQVGRELGRERRWI